MGSAYLALCFVTAVGAFSGYYILTNEAKIKCDAEGHAWKCTRKCKKDTQTLLPPAIEKVNASTFFSDVFVKADWIHPRLMSSSWNMCDGLW